MYRSTLFLTSLLLSTSTAVLVDYQVWVPHPIPRFRPISEPYAKSCPEQLHRRCLLLRQHQRHRRHHRQRLHLPRPAPRLHSTSHRLSPASFVSNYDRFGGLQPGSSSPDGRTTQPGTTAIRHKTDSNWIWVDGRS